MSVTFRDCRSEAAPCLPVILYQYLPPALMMALEPIRGRWEELHLRLHRASSVTADGENILVDTREVFRPADMEELIGKLCAGSRYAFHDRINEGYLTLPGGIRVGLGGRAATEAGEERDRMLGVRAIDSVCFRFPHPGLLPGEALAERILADFPQGALIYSPPGVGKTTLLRALAVRFSEGKDARRVVVIDTRDELNDGSFDRPLCLTLLSGYPKARGIEIATRSLSAQIILCDEIGTPEEADAILEAANCGVPLIATAHAADVRGLLRRPAFRALHDACVFGNYIGIERSRRLPGEFDYAVTPRASFCHAD